MSALRHPNPQRTVCGIIRDLDVPGRQLTLLVNDTPIGFDVAPECDVVLHRDRVKLRMLQSGDYARIVYSKPGQNRVAASICVHWWYGEATEARVAADAPHAPVPQATVRLEANESARSTQ